MSSPGPSPSAGRTRPPGTWRIGRVAGGDLLVTPSALVLVAMLAVLMRPTVEEISPGLGAWGYVVGALYAVALYAAVLLHEVAHAVAARRYGFRVDSVTLRFLGGATQIDREARTPGQELVIAVVGPLASVLVGVLVLAVEQVAGTGLVAAVLLTLGAANVAIGVLNLVPGLPLDGGRVLKALVWRVSGDPHRGTLVAGWGGRLVAVLVVLWPVLLRLGGGSPSLTIWLVALVLGAFLWTGASAAMSSARMRSRLPHLVARRLARPALAVPGETSVAEAVRRVREAGAGSLVTVDAAGHPIGIVSEAAVVAVPEQRRPWVPVSSVSRALVEGARLPADLSGEDLVLAITRLPAEEYLLVEQDGSVLGVLVTADVDRAFREAG